MNGAQEQCSDPSAPPSATTSTSNTTPIFSLEVTKDRLNQYWYSKKTIHTMLSEVLHHATRVAFLSTPSLFFALDQPLPLLSSSSSTREHTTSSSGSTSSGVTGDVETPDEEARRKALRAQSTLFEYDMQFASDPNFVFYDFQKPDQIPIQHLGQYDYVVVDPPFITEDVWSAYMLTVKLLLVPSGEDGAAVGPAGVCRPSLGKGKVLFTTVLENHPMLEHHLQGPLYIPRFRPLVHYLTYQYVCFTNYVATRLNERINDEVEPEEEKILAGIEIANRIRASEEEFAQQMRARLRETGEQPLPNAAYQRECAQAAAVEAAEQKRARIQTLLAGTEASPQQVEASSKPWEAMALEEMPWGHIPEALRPFLSEPSPSSSFEGPRELPRAYARGVQNVKGKMGLTKEDIAVKGTDGLTDAGREDEVAVSSVTTTTTTTTTATTSGTTATAEEEVGAKDATEVELLRTLRQDLDAFKGRIDVVQKILHEELQAKSQVLKKRKEWIESGGSAGSESKKENPATTILAPHPEGPDASQKTAEKKEAEPRKVTTTIPNTSEKPAEGILPPTSSLSSSSLLSSSAEVKENAEDQKREERSTSKDGEVAPPPALLEAQEKREMIRQRRMRVLEEMTELSVRIQQKEEVAALLRMKEDLAVELQKEEEHLAEPPQTEEDVEIHRKKKEDLVVRLEKLKEAIAGRFLHSTPGATVPLLPSVATADSSVPAVLLATTTTTDSDVRVLHQGATAVDAEAPAKRAPQEITITTTSLLLPSYVPVMEECVERYRRVEIKKSVLLELASSATGRYKAPLFGRMKALLQEMKALKNKLS